LIESFVGAESFVDDDDVLEYFYIKRSQRKKQSDFFWTQNEI